MANFAKTPTTNNTYLSDLNEILCGYHLNKKKWFDAEAKRQHDLRMSQVTLEQYADANGKAEAMAKEFLKFAQSHTWRLPVKAIAWTARPGSATKFVGKEVDQKHNPSDLIVKFAGGPHNGFLGLSAKATKGKGDIGFKNPGLGTIEKTLGIKLYPIADKIMDEVVAKYKLSDSKSQRKIEIRKNPKIQIETRKAGAEITMALRDEVLKKLLRLDNKKLFDYILDNLMDAQEQYPKYIKVTGHGTHAPYSANSTDPTKNEKLDYLAKGKIKVEKTGENGIGFSANGKRIFKMRLKWESEPLATSIKVSVEPW